MPETYHTNMTIRLRVEADSIREARRLTHLLAEEVRRHLPTGASALPGADALSHTAEG